MRCEKGMRERGHVEDKALSEQGEEMDVQGGSDEESIWMKEGTQAAG